MACKDCSTDYPDDPPVIKNHKIVDTFEEVGQFRNAFVTVREENAVYHTDEAGNAISVSRNDIYDNEYTPTTGDYKRLTVFNFVAEEFYVFDGEGNYKTGTLT